MNRKITDHIINPANDKLEIQVLDSPGAGGANHEYGIVKVEKELRGSEGSVECRSRLTQIQFQNGPINENGINGVTQEALIAICIDRLRSFQAGPFSCRENAIALTHLETALLWLQKRTLDRIQRGVEGTHQK